jgi:zinc transport system substrate-binding protein
MLRPREICIAVTLLLAALPAKAAPDVLATIKPVHSLVAAVMEGVGTPDLLIGGAGSPHSYALKPSDAFKIERAALIFEIGPDVETYLTQPLATLGSHGRVVALERAPDVRLLPARRGGLWQADSEDGPNDPHSWLDPENAVAMTDAIAAALAQTDPGHAAAYRANAARETATLAALDKELAANLAPLRERPYLVFHDAYRYFEARYGLDAAGAVTVGPDRPVGPRRVEELRQAIARQHISCLFLEADIPPKLADTLAEGNALKTGELDEVGARLTPGPGLYPALLRGIAHALTQCLAKR